MTTNKLNINLILCQEYDKKTKTIKKIFNEITTNNKHEATFSVITFVNGLYGDNEEDRFILHYFLVQAKENTKQNVERPRMGLYLGATEFYRRPEKNLKITLTTAITHFQNWHLKMYIYWRRRIYNRSL